MTETTPEALLHEMTEAHDRERALVTGLTEEQVRADSALPGWTRGHVLGARLAFLRAAHRQVSCALSGDRADFYDGGRPGREAQIDAHAARPGADLVRDVLHWTSAVDTAFASLSPEGWTRTVTYRGEAPVTALACAAWRECELHVVDLDVGVRPSQWSTEFCARLFDFLEPRVPDGTRLDLVADDGFRRSLGAGTPIQVHGALTDLAAWIAGRQPVGAVTAAGGRLPVLRRLREAQGPR
jgi:maleylpyruvate isomerase